MKKAIKIIFLSVGGFFVFCFFVGLMLPDRPKTTAEKAVTSRSSAVSNPSIHGAAGRYRVSVALAPAIRDLNDGTKVSQASTDVQLRLELIRDGRLGFFKEGDMVDGIMQVQQMMQVNGGGGPLWVLASHVERVN